MERGFHALETHHCCRFTDFIVSTASVTPCQCSESPARTGSTEEETASGQNGLHSRKSGNGHRAPGDDRWHVKGSMGEKNTVV